MAALGGLLFGFDTIVISGAEQHIQKLWSLSGLMHGICISAALWGTVLGSLTGGIPAERFGRKQTLLVVGILYLASSAGTAVATGAVSFVAARVLGGIGVGLSTVASPLYMSEIAPADIRGRLTGLFQLNVVLGIILAFVSNFIVALLCPADVAWRVMVGVMALPSACFTCLCHRIPESPRWLLSVGRSAEAKQAFREINPAMSEEELATLVRSVELALQSEERGRADVQSKRTDPIFWTDSLSRPISLAFAIALFNQLSGINAVLYFAPRIFQWAGLEHSAAMLQSVGIGLTNLAFTFLGIQLIDQLGRRRLLAIGALGAVGSLAGCSWAFATAHVSLVPVYVFAFIGAHAVGQGTVIWVFISEIFPPKHRAAGQTLGSCTHWVAAALLTLVFPAVAEVSSPTTIFGFFACMMALSLLWVIRCVPETKGVPLEDMEILMGISPQSTCKDDPHKESDGEADRLAKGCSATPTYTTGADAAADTSMLGKAMPSV